MKIKDKKLLEIIQKAKEGDQIAFNVLLDNFWNSVYNYQIKKNQNDNDAEDITIQTFSKAFDKISSFDKKYQFKTWLIAISKNVYIDYLRKKKPHIIIEPYKGDYNNSYDIADNNPTPEDKIITKQNFAKLLKDIEQLNPKHQEVITLRYFQELSYKEISEQINEPVNNIKVKLLRAKKLLVEITNRI